MSFLAMKKLPRRTLLRGAGVSVAVPWLSAMEKATAGAKGSAPLAPQRFVSMTLGLGLLASELNPEEAGRDYKPSQYLKKIDDIRDSFTVISGSSHPGVKGGHLAEASLLTANPAGGTGGARNSISIDQLMAKHLGDATRYPSLVVGSAGSNSPSYTENGAMIPAETSPSAVFAKLFIDDAKDEKAQRVRRVRHGRSIMDLVASDAKQLNRQLGAGDKRRLDQYFSSVRDLEVRLAKSEAWAKRPKPTVDRKRPVDIGNSNDFIGRQKLMSDMIRLALQTDSTRFISYHLGGSGGVLPIAGVEEGYHALSHHGKDEKKLEQLTLIETEIVATWGQFLRDLASVEDAEGNLLNNTSVILTSNLGNASNHDTRNMPVLLGGGRFRHGQHLAFDQKNNYPLPNLYVSLLQRMGLPMDQFASGTSTMTGLEMT
ncbi:hypothetical protein FF011L_14890 [Roseimaritima multifibrata]|uniref:DUF1552 domain-containing protein n=1 Tax=Roseimaritima multifibrata TaxID=1930274 RepID=A0A517MCX8_9BACT|nr:DUF1552 domain-containing protein [Roseimaritima multifibrata]QDS92740.1 hypothetical protein FF011L_14890 [Roseimaritima multifibrata]